MTPLKYTTAYRDHESQRHEKVNAWICARQTTDHDLASVIPDKKERERERCTSVITVISCGLFFELIRSVSIFLPKLLHTESRKGTLLEKRCGIIRERIEVIRRKMEPVEGSSVGCSAENKETFYTVMVFSGAGR